MSFSWVPFLEQHGVHYVTTGKNVGKGRIAVKCPFCGAADPSEHMSIALSGLGWRCWRNRQHSGAKPNRLIRALTGMSAAAIAALVGDGGRQQLPLDFMSAVRDLLEDAPPSPPAELPVIRMPKELRKIDTSLAARPYERYLRFKRGLTLEQVAPYDLRFAVSGEWSGRVVVPVSNRKGQLVALTGRHIGRNVTALRYKASGAHISEVLLFEDWLFKPQRAEVLVVTEGPFDAIKVDALGRHLGIRATCVFTSGPSARQIATLRLLTERFKRVVALFDDENEQTSFRLADQIPGVEPLVLPESFKDPGELRFTADLLSAVDHGQRLQKPRSAGQTAV